MSKFDNILFNYVVPGFVIVGIIYLVASAFSKALGQ